MSRRPTPSRPPTVPVLPGRSALSVLAVVLEELELHGLIVTFEGLRGAGPRFRAELLLELPALAPPGVLWAAEIGLHVTPGGCLVRPWLGLAEGHFSPPIEELNRLDRVIWQRLEAAAGALAARTVAAGTAA